MEVLQNVHTSQVWVWKCYTTHISSGYVHEWCTHTCTRTRVLKEQHTCPPRYCVTGTGILRIRAWMSSYTYCSSEVLARVVHGEIHRVCTLQNTILHLQIFRVQVWRSHRTHRHPRYNMEVLEQLTQVPGRYAHVAPVPVPAPATEFVSTWIYPYPG